MLHELLNFLRFEAFPFGLALKIFIQNFVNFINLETNFKFFLKFSFEEHGYITFGRHKEASTEAIIFLFFIA